MNDETMSWLLEKENPSVRFFALTTLLDRPQDDPEVMEAKAAIMSDGLVPEILSRQNGDGSWGVPERLYSDKYTGTVWTLLMLAELGADGGDDRIRNASEFIFTRSQNPEGGGFSIGSSAKTGRGIASGVIPCLTGNMSFSLIQLGYAEDARLQSAIDWIVRYQRADDNTDNPPTGGLYDRFEVCFGKHTCFMAAAKTLKALAALPKNLRTPEIRSKIDELAEFFLIHHIYMKSHHLDEVAKPGWLKFGFPLMYQTDVLEMLALFANLGIHDPRLSEALEVVRAKQTASGRWNLENTFNGKTTVNIEKKGAPSKWITLRALRVLKEFSVE
jgi:hypothetical protein